MWCTLCLLVCMPVCKVGSEGWAFLFHFLVHLCVPGCMSVSISSHMHAYGQMYMSARGFVPTYTSGCASPSGSPCMSSCDVCTWCC